MTKGVIFFSELSLRQKRMDQLEADILALSLVQWMELPAAEVDGENIVREALHRLEDQVPGTGATVRVLQGFPD